jgi:D-beta-D-heptose 7-phosphate kinase/D-beta-D-heptose 1-phosphate adenosyltransferase
MATRIDFKRLPPERWNWARLETLLDAIGGQQILVLGDLGVDRYTQGAVDRISPEAPVPILRVLKQELKLGLAANVADNVRALGGVPVLVGVVGRDRAAEDFRALLKRARVHDQGLIVDASRATVLKDRMVSERQQMLRVDYEDTQELSQKTLERVLARFKQVLPACGSVVVEDYAKGLLQPALLKGVYAAIASAKKIDVTDPNSKTDLQRYRGARLFKPNRKEAEILSGVKISDERSLSDAARVLFQKTKAQEVLITLGRDGMALFSRGKSKAELIPTLAREVFDVSGAGDTVTAVLALGVAAGASVSESAQLANIAAGIEVGKFGTATVSPDELRSEMRRLQSK